MTKMSVSDRKKLFESAMEEHLKPSPKPGENICMFLTRGYIVFFMHYIIYNCKIYITFKWTNIYAHMQIYCIYIIVCIHVTDKIFSFLSQDEVEKMRQEEGKLLSFFHSFTLYNLS